MKVSKTILMARCFPTFIDKIKQRVISRVRFAEKNYPRSMNHHKNTEFRFQLNLKKAHGKIPRFPK